jgi:hypothetical protein
MTTTTTFDCHLSDADDADKDSDGETLSVSDAADIWLSKVWMRTTGSATPRKNCAAPPRNSRTQVQARYRNRVKAAVGLWRTESRSAESARHPEGRIGHRYSRAKPQSRAFLCL